MKNFYELLCLSNMNNFFFIYLYFYIIEKQVTKMKRKRKKFNNMRLRQDQNEKPEFPHTKYLQIFFWRRRCRHV